MKKWLPNILTLGNLLAGILACVVLLLWRDFELAALFIGAGLIFDFLDGFVARRLNVSGELGKQLDSLADLVSFGLVPGLLVFVWLNDIREADSIFEIGWSSFVGLLIPLFSAIRLAKFNIDERQSESFIGFPTPANAVLWVSLPLTQWVLPFGVVLILVLVTSLLLISELPLFSLKFKTFKFLENKLRYSFIISVLMMLIFATFILKNVFVAFPIIIILYLILSILNKQFTKNNGV